MLAAVFKAEVIKMSILSSRSITCRRDSSDQASEHGCLFFVSFRFSTGNSLSLKGIGKGNKLLRETGTHGLLRSL